MRVNFYIVIEHPHPVMTQSTHAQHVPAKQKKRATVSGSPKKCDHQVLSVNAITCTWSVTGAIARSVTCTVTMAVASHCLTSDNSHSCEKCDYQRFSKNFHNTVSLLLDKYGLRLSKPILKIKQSLVMHALFSPTGLFGHNL
jgi:hypothetical protein